MLATSSLLLGLFPRLSSWPGSQAGSDEVLLFTYFRDNGEHGVNVATSDGRL